MIKQVITDRLREALEKIGLFEEDVEIALQRPRARDYGDLSTNLAMVLAKKLGRKPRELAGQLAAALSFDKEAIDSVEIAGPGFINFRFARSLLISHMLDIWRDEGIMQELKTGGGKRINVEYISANPTGPLNVVSARAGAFGSTLVRLLRANGFDAHSEYYVNDAGRQVDLLGRSLRARYQQLQGEDVSLPEGGYLGRYLEIMAAELRDLDSKAIQAAASAFDDESFQRVSVPEGNAEDWCQLPDSDSVQRFAKYALMKILGWQRETCRRFGLQFDTWYFESEIHETKRLTRALEELRKKGATFENEGATWFRSTDFGDEKDRVLIRSDGQSTYFLADVAYHYHKYQRGFERAIVFWGPDHHGYIPRLQGAMLALGIGEKWLEVQILQQVNFLEQGRPVNMGKRQGRFITMDELCDEVGADVAKFVFLTRKPGSHLDFDLDLTRDESSENPVFYVKYAHARISSVFRKAAQNKVDPGEPERETLSALTEKSEWDLIRELVRLPEVLASAAQAREPHRLTGYILDVAGRFHNFYTQCVILGSDPEVSRSRLHLCLICRRVFAQVLELLGVEAPERMGEKIKE